MEKTYKKIEVGFCNLEDAVEILQSHKEKGELVFLIFNNVPLYSDIDDVDSAYKKVTGKTKSEFDEAVQKRHEEYEVEKRKHEESIPRLTIEWIEKGNIVLDKEYHEKWAKCVPIRLGDLYRGMELKCCLDIVNELNKGCTLEEAKEMIEEQGHSGMSFSLVCSMVRSFCNRGQEFVELVNPK